MTKFDFIKKANKKHNCFYNYSLVEYKNNKTKVKIICKKHGIFEQQASAHLQGQGCPSCKVDKIKNKLTLSNDIFIKRANIIHNNKYNYSLTNYVHHNKKVKIICPEHGEFQQIPNNHLQGKGCFKCAIIKRSNNQKYNKNDIIKLFNNIYNNKYDYSLVSYNSIKEKIKIICPIHGIFSKSSDKHLQGQGCPKCSRNVSKPEREISSFLDSLNVDYKQSDRSIIKPYELDIVIPSKNIAIEFNGVYWHSEQALKSKNINFKKYHQQKYLDCKNKGYQLLSIFEPEWIFKKDIIKSIICAKLNIYETKIGARKCEIKQINSSICRQFMNENHIQGFSNGSVHLGLFFKNQLVSAISFRKNKDSFELVRFVNKKNTLVHGAFSKLLKYFINNNNFNNIYTFADLRYFEGGVYEKNGFKFVHEVAPSYYYFKGFEMFHKMNFRHSKLKKKFKNYNSKLTEYQNCLNHGYDRIWDCGKLKFECRL